MSGPNYRIEDLQIQEIVQDPANFISEVSIDCRGDEVIAVYVRHRGLKHTDDGTIMFIKSHDGGKTWDLSTHVVAMPEHDAWGYTSPACLILRDGTLLVLAVANLRAGDRAGLEDRGYGGWVARSTDGGKTWSEFELIRAFPMRAAYPWDNPIEMPDGTLRLAVYGTMDSALSGGSSQERSRNALLWSDDQGRHWYYYGTIAFDPAGGHDFWEPSIALTPGGHMVALSREGLAVLGNNPPGGYLFFSESEDDGSAWSPFKRTNVWGYPPDLVTLKDGSILNVYGHRKDPMSIKVVVSEDGRSWLEKNASTLYGTPSYDTRDLGSGKWVIDSGYRHIGYPSACVLDDGTVLAVFHSFNEDKKQIVLVARFRMVRNAV